MKSPMADPEVHQDIGELRADMRALRGEVANLRQDFKEANGSIKELTAALNQAKGAKAAAYAMTAMVSVFVSVLTFLGMGFVMKGH